MSKKWKIGDLLSRPRKQDAIFAGSFRDRMWFKLKNRRKFFGMKKETLEKIN